MVTVASIDPVRATYSNLVASGELVGKQRLVFAELLRIGPATSGEVLREMASSENGPRIDNINAWRARFTELQGRGLIREGGQRRCRVSGRLAVVWEATGRSAPLSLHRGRSVSGSEWKDIARRLAVCLAVGDQRDGSVAVLEDYRKLVARAKRK